MNLRIKLLEARRVLHILAIVEYAIVKCQSGSRNQKQQSLPTFKSNGQFKFTVVIKYKD